MPFAIKLPVGRGVPFSAKARLTFVFTVLFGMIVVGLAIAFYFLTSHEVYSKLQSVLQTAIGATEMSTQHELDEHDTLAQAEADVLRVLTDSQAKALAQTQIYVLEGNRKVAYKRDSQSTAAIPVSELLSGRTPPNMHVVHDHLLVPKFNTAYEIYAAATAEPAIDYLTGLRHILLVVVPFGLALAAYCGYVMAARSLRPLSDLTRTIDEVTTADLSARVKLPDQEGGEIASLASRFNALLDRLEQAFNAQRRFMADASHELRTPVTVALTAAQVAMRNPKRGLRDCEESLEVIEEQMLRLKRIIQDMFFLSQADGAPLTLRMQPLFLDDVVSEAIRAARTLANAKKQTIKVTALPEARCVGDEDLLKQALLILLENSVKYTPTSGEVSVTLASEGNHWVCRIVDTGSGISEAAQARIFERFYRDPNLASMKTPGAGLGLAIAKSIIEAHHGTLVLVESRPGYTCFEIALPIADGEIPLTAGQANSLAVKI